MKKLSYIFLLPALAIATSIGMASCDDDFSSPHVLTQAELDEMRRQDSILQENLKRIDADLVIDITVEDYPSTQWASKSLTLDFAPVAELFGLTEDEIISGFQGNENAPAVEGFAIQSTSHADYPKASNTNGAWGHWWRIDGDVASTYDEEASRFFLEWAGYYDEEKGQNVESYFNVGQFPRRCVAGDEITVIECLKYQTKRVAFRITYKVIDRGEVQAGIAGTQKLTLTTTTAYDYEALPIEFDLSKACSDLGVSTLDGLAWIAGNADGSYAQEYTADAPGFWYDMDGFAGSWSDDASVYATYRADDPDKIYVGQFPSHLAEGTSLMIKFGVTAGDLIEMFEITVNIEGFQDPETAPAGDPENVTHDVTFTKPYTDDYATVDEDVREILRNAFKMTTYQIFQALQKGDMKIYIGEVTEKDPTYTGGTAGENWIDAEGNQTDYGNGVFYTGIDASTDALGLYLGNHPENCSPAGQSCMIKMIATCNGGSVTFNIKADITAKE